MRNPLGKYGIIALTAAFLGAGILGFVPQSGQAATGSLKNYQSEQKELNSNIANKKKVINEKKAQKKTVQSQINDLDMKLDKIQVDMRKAESQIKTANGQLSVINKDLKDAEIRLDERNILLQNRVKDLYTQGDVSIFDVLFQSSSFSDFLMCFDMMGKVVDQDAVLLEQVKKDRAIIQDKQKQQKSKIQDLNQMKQAKYNSLLQLKSVKKEKKVVMAQVDQDKEAAEQALDALEQASNDVAAQIRKIQEENRRKAEEAARKRNAESSSGSGSSGSSGGSSDSGYVEYNGVFKWPLPGHSGVSSEFGMRRHPVTGRVKLHTGIDIPASSGTTIVAAADGEVLFAGNNSAYGKMVIIDHGGGVSSVYAHMSSISMGGGQKVSKGERVGGVGSTGLSTGNHLHFEVREYGDPVSPWKYLK